MKIFNNNFFIYEFSEINICKKNGAGFTLIEVLVYIGLLSIIITGSLSTAYYVLNSSRRLNSAISKNEEINFVFQKLAWALSGASNINLPLEGQSGTLLSVNKNGFADNPLIFSLSSGKLYLQEGSNPPLPLNTSILDVQNFMVQNVKNPAGWEINVDLTINHENFKVSRYLK
jgi:type II secretory pathway pseudopilin PulG